MSRFYLFAFIIFAEFAKAQSLGFIINPAIDIQQGIQQGAPKPYFGLSCGLYYDQKIYKCFGFSTGIEYTQIESSILNDNFDPSINSFQATAWRQHTYLAEAPLDITLLLNTNKEAKCYVYLTSGYAVGYMFEQATATYNNDGKIYYSYSTYPLSKSVIANTFRLGVEVRYNPKPKLNLAFGFQFKYIAVYPSFASDNPERFNVLGLYVKTGLSFLSKKTAQKRG